ncbi:MAG: flagellar hook-length control protein FliK [Pseudomonadota bacterium]
MNNALENFISVSRKEASVTNSESIKRNIFKQTSEPNKFSNEVENSVRQSKPEARQAKQTTPHNTQDKQTPHKATRPQDNQDTQAKPDVQNNSDTQQTSEQQQSETNEGQVTDEQQDGAQSSAQSENTSETEIPSTVDAISYTEQNTTASEQQQFLASLLSGTTEATQAQLTNEALNADIVLEQGLNTDIKSDINSLNPLSKAAHLSHGASASDVRQIQGLEQLRQAINTQAKGDVGQTNTQETFESQLLAETQNAETTLTNGKSPDSLKQDALTFLQKQNDLTKPDAIKIDFAKQDSLTSSQLLTTTTSATSQQQASPSALSQSSPRVPVNSLAVHIATQAQNGARRFDIRLDPPELGRIDVRLDMNRDGSVNTHIIVERSETLDLMQRDARQLERALNNSGLDVKDGELTFSLKDHGFAEQETADHEQSDQSNETDENNETQNDVQQILNVNYRRMQFTNLDIRI